jgi:hypothetical protein
MSVCLAFVWRGSGVGDDEIGTRCVLSQVTSELKCLVCGHNGKRRDTVTVRGHRREPRTENPLPSPPPINGLCIVGCVGHASVQCDGGPLVLSCLGDRRFSRCVDKANFSRSRCIAEIRGRRIQCWLFLRLLRRCSHCTQRRERCRQQHTRSGGRRFGPDWRPLPPLLCRS